MQRVITTAVLASAIAASVAVAQVVPRSGGASGLPAERRIALLIGIDVHPAGEGQPPALRGPRNDVQLVRDLLTRRFGFQIEDEDVLLGEQATHEAIVRTFHRRLVERADSDTRVVFWYSGHGSVIPDASGVESNKDKFDEHWQLQPRDNSLVAYDSRSDGRRGEYDVSDDEIHSLLRALGAKTSKITLVMDCCHAGGNVRGTAIRSADHGTRLLDRKAIEAFWPVGVPFLDDDQRPAAPRLRYVQIAACEEAQLAGEVEIGGKWYGTLTWFLVRALDAATPSMSWRRVAERTRAEVAGQGDVPSQLVSCEGTGLDEPVFGGGFVAPRPGFAVDWDGPAQVRIAAGRVHGIGDDETFTLWDASGHEVGKVQVCRLYGHACMAALKADAAKPAYEPPLRAVPHGDGEGRSALRIALGDGVDPGLLRDVGPAKVVPATEADYRVERKGDRLWLQDDNGVSLRSVAVDRGELRRALFHEHAFRALWEAPAQQGDWSLELRGIEADAATRQFVDAELPAATVRPAKGPRALVEAPPATQGSGGGAMTIAVRNTSKSELHVAVLSVGQDRIVRLVWPNDDRRDNLLGPGKEQRIPVRVGVPATWHAERRGPMVDRYIAVGTPYFADLRPLCSDAAPEPGARSDARLPAFLARAAGSAPSRGKPVGFGIAWFDLELHVPR